MCSISFADHTFLATCKKAEKSNTLISKKAANKQTFVCVSGGKKC